MTDIWSTETLNLHLIKIMDERHQAYQQRWEAQEKAVAAALSAAEKAVASALTAQEKSVATAFNAQEKAVASALSAAERAVSKAETASEKRFDTINEKIESNAQILDKFDLNTKSLVNKMDDLREYKDTTSGKATGINASWVALLGIGTLVIGVVTVLVMLKS